MYSNKTNINILTSLLARHGIKHVVVCPGSRNGAIIHNLYESPDIICYPVTDERSAGFYALGMAKALNQPVAVCVTSGTALLNLAPAVAEATYSHNGIIVISGDRPQAWIDQNDGQTLPQAGAFGRLAAKSFQLPEPNNDTERWFCNRQINEAILESKRTHRPSVHINVPISRPLFEFTTDTLPNERIIKRVRGTIDDRKTYSEVLSSFMEAERPMIVIGQTDRYAIDADDFNTVAAHAVIINEPLSYSTQYHLFDAAINDIQETEDFVPDILLYMGGTIVSSKIRSFLRSCNETEIWEISEDGSIHDVFMNTCGVIEATPHEIFASLAVEIEHGTMTDDTDAFDILTNSPMAYRNRWKELFDKWEEHRNSFIPEYSQMSAIKCFEDCLKTSQTPFAVHYANSMPVRIANIYATHYIYVNRGVNGIDGTISTAAGHSVISDDMVYCVSGDLSFFYDQNALWNRNLAGNFRILLINNGGGGIFYGLSGLDKTKARDKYIAGCHNVSAEGICIQNDIAYMAARNIEEMQEMMPRLISGDSERPVLLEVFTDVETDTKVLNKFFEL